MLMKAEIEQREQGYSCKRELTERKKEKKNPHTYVHLILVRLRYRFIVLYS